MAKMMDAILSENDIGMAAKRVPDIALSEDIAFVAGIASLDPKTTSGYDWSAALRGQQEKIAAFEKAGQIDTDAARIARYHADILTAHRNVVQPQGAAPKAKCAGPKP